VTTLVHGAAAEQAAAEAAQVLFGGDPTTASAEALAVVAREVPSSEMTREQLGDQIAVLVQSGLAASNGEARRTLTQKGFKANGQTLEETKSLLEVDLLHGRYMLLRKGKTNFHLLTVTN
jgi:tyrosyl-tRNA synthetase